MALNCLQDLMTLILNKFLLEYHFFVISFLQKNYSSVLKSYRLFVVLCVGLYHTFEEAVFLFLSLLEEQILKVVVTNFEAGVAKVPGWICLISFLWTLSFYVKVINKITLRGKKKKKRRTSFTHFNCSLLKSVGNSVFLGVCNHKVLSFSNKCHCEHNVNVWFSSPTSALRNLFIV